MILTIPTISLQLLTLKFSHFDSVTVLFNAVVFDVFFFFLILYFLAVSFSSPILSLFFSCAWLMAAVLHFFRSIFLRNGYMKKWKIWEKKQPSSTSVYSFSHKHITKPQQCITAHCSSWHHFEQRCADLKVILWFFVSLLCFLLPFYSFDALFVVDFHSCSWLCIDVTVFIMVLFIVCVVALAVALLNLCTCGNLCGC